MLTIRELIKTLYNAFSQKLNSKLKASRGNWEQNDPTADDYIKNRPFYTDESDKVVKIDKKYLPDLGLAPVATSGSYNDLSDTPLIYTDIVRYGTIQNLTTAQKTRTRTNIGAVGYESQSLTDAQKTQARTNIGAGTSNFSGSYDDLTNKPTGLATETYVNDKIAAIPTPDVSGQILEHDTSITSHGDIRELITSPKDGVAFVDQVSGYIYIACIRDGNFVTHIGIKSIEVTTMPTKIEYIVGEYFDPAGMVVTATTYDGATKEITDFTCPSLYFVEGDTSVKITYIEGGIVHIATVPVIVIAFDAATVLVDFEYTANDDGTYTITGWKGTLNGETSTEMIIPNNGLIIV